MPPMSSRQVFSQPSLLNGSMYRGMMIAVGGRGGDYRGERELLALELQTGQKAVGHRRAGGHRQGVR